MIVSTDAIVLRSMKYRDTSKIVTLYSEKFGKISVLAKGARAAKNKFGASLEPMTHSSVVIYKKERRELYLLSQSEIVQPFFRTRGEPEKLAIGLAVIELVHLVMHDEEENRHMFALLNDALHALEIAKQRAFNVLLAFELKLVRHLGFAPYFESCSRCGAHVLEDDEVRFVHVILARGSVLCSKCIVQHDGAGIRLSKGALRALVSFASAPMEEVAERPIDSRGQNEILALLQTYMQYHVAGARTLRSLSLLNVL
ncbi:MAG: DNA repair protein RecO [Bacteroidota bacterium]|nr:DNA repair protein RecO [Bacteroidota bacterium]